jgi:hypothetical protein
MVLWGRASGAMHPSTKHARPPKPASKLLINARAPPAYLSVYTPSHSSRAQQ